MQLIEGALGPDVGVVVVVLVVGAVLVVGVLLVVGEVLLVVVVGHTFDLFVELDQQGGFPPATAKEVAVPAATNRPRAAT